MIKVANWTIKMTNAAPITSKMAMPGTKDSKGLVNKKPCPELTMAPQVAVGGIIPMPR